MKIACGAIVWFLLVPLFALSESQQFAGWGRLANHLMKDGVSPSLVFSVYGGEAVPPFDFVPFKLSPKESSSIYEDLLSSKNRLLGRRCLASNAESLQRAQSLFGVEGEIVTAIITVESHCGQTFGKESVLERLSRVSNVGEEANLQRNFEELAQSDSSVTKARVKARAQYLEAVFYPQLRALFFQHEKGSLDVFSLKGSSAGAFGWPQFLPLTFEKYGIDGDLDGQISLFSARDAIFSTAHFLAAHGWSRTLSRAQKHDIIWKYNRSEPYIETVLHLSESF